MTDFVAITDHAKKRSLRRFGILPAKLKELAQKAIIEGYSTGDAPSEKIGKYLQRKIKGNRKAYGYQGYIFIYSEDLVLITTFRMPRYLLLSLPRTETYIGTN